MKKSIVWTVLCMLLVSGLYACGAGGGSSVADTAAPGAPTGLITVTTSSTSVECNWNAATDNVGVTGYRVYRNGTQIGTTSNTTYTDTGLISDTTYTYTVAAYDAAQNVSMQSAPASARTLAASLRVRVVNYYTKAPVPGATVVLGDSDGVMQSSATADTNGECTFNNPPLNATVTSVQGTDPDYEIDIAYDVNSSAVTLGLSIGGANSGMPAPVGSEIGTQTLNIQNTLGGVRNSVFIGGSKYASNSLVTQGTYTVYSTDIQSDKLSIFALSYDATDQPVGYGALLDQTYSAGTTSNISVDQPVSFVQYQMANIPSATALDEYFFYYRKGIRLPGSSTYSILSAPTNTSLTHYYLPDVGDHFSYQVTVSSGTSSGIQFNFQGAAVLPNQTVDLSHPAIPSNIMVSYATGTATATLSWTGADPSAGVLYGSGSAGTTNNFRFTAAPSRTSIRFPQLPDSVAAARPSGIGWFNVQEETASFLAGYEDFLGKWDQLSSGTWTYPASGFSKTSYGSYYGL